MKASEKADKILNYLEDKYKDRVADRNSGEPFKTLISTILSQRTREENTAKASKKLFSVAETPEEILNLEKEQLQDLIRPSGFYRQKADYIRETCKMLLEEYDGKVPKDREELMKLPGVGYKTSGVVLCYAFGKPLVPVDVHVEVCSKRLGLVSKDASPKEVESKLEELIPKEKRYFINIGFVMFGREFCKTRSPRCKVCPIKQICEYYHEKTLSTN